MNTDIELPPLPKPRPYGYIAKTEYLFTAAQMRDYARACIAADRAKRAAGEPVKLVPSVFGFPPSPPAQRVEKAAPAPADRTLFRQMLEHLYSLDADKPLRWHLRGGLAGEVTDIALAVIGRPASAPMEANADEQERALQELVDDAQEFGMGYGADPTGMTPVAADRLTEVECPPDPDIVDRALAALEAAEHFLSSMQAVYERMGLALDNVSPILTKLRAAIDRLAASQAEPLAVDRAELASELRDLACVCIWDAREEARDPENPVRAKDRKDSVNALFDAIDRVAAAPAPAEQNQCDGCLRGLPVSGGLHRPEGEWPFGCSTPAREAYGPLFGED